MGIRNYKHTPVDVYLCFRVDLKFGPTGTDITQFAILSEIWLKVPVFLASATVLLGSCSNQTALFNCEVRESSLIEIPSDTISQLLWKEQRNRKTHFNHQNIF